MLTVNHPWHGAHFGEKAPQKINAAGKINIASSIGKTMVTSNTEISTVCVDSNLSVLAIMSTTKTRAITIIIAIKIRMNGSNSFLKK